MMTDMNVPAALDEHPASIGTDPPVDLGSDDLIGRSTRFLVQTIATIELGDRRRIRAVRRWLTGYAGELRARLGVGNEIDDVLDRLEAVLLLWSEQPNHEIAGRRALLLALQIGRLSAIDDGSRGPDHMATLRRRGWFPVAWYLSGIDVDVRRTMLELTPMRRRVLYRMTRGRYERLVRRAVGSGAGRRPGRARSV
jgi:hypothetical protein